MTETRSEDTVRIGQFADMQYASSRPTPDSPTRYTFVAVYQKGKTPSVYLSYVSDTMRDTSISLNAFYKKYESERYVPISENHHNTENVYHRYSN